MQMKKGKSKDRPRPQIEPRHYQCPGHTARVPRFMTQIQTRPQGGTGINTSLLMLQDIPRIQAQPPRIC